MRRHRAEGETGLLDRSSRPHRSPTATPEQWVQLIALLRRSTRMTGAAAAAARTISPTRCSCGAQGGLRARSSPLSDRLAAGHRGELDVGGLGAAEPCLGEPRARLDVAKVGGFG